jgi:hypothetical protein
LAAAGRYIAFVSWAHGYDTPFLLTRGKLRALSVQRAETPAVTASGRVAWVNTTFGTDDKAHDTELVVADPPTWKPRVAVDLPGDLSFPEFVDGTRTVAFLADVAIAARVKLVDLVTKRVVKVIDPKIPGATYYTGNGRGLVALGDHAREEIVDVLSGRITLLPPGWGPYCFSPDGSEVLLVHEHDLAVVAVDEPLVLRRWGKVNADVLLGAAWM